MAYLQALNVWPYYIAVLPTTCKCGVFNLTEVTVFVFKITFTFLHSYLYAVAFIHWEFPLCKVNGWDSCISVFVKEGLLL